MATFTTWRRNPLHAQVSKSPAATILFNGPHGYVSPHHAGRGDCGPAGICHSPCCRWQTAHLSLSTDVFGGMHFAKLGTNG